MPKDQRHDLKRCSDRVTDPTSGRVYLHPVPGAKEKWRPETGDKFEKVKLFHKCPTFQDGRHSHTQKPSSKGRLASKYRTERCILFCRNKQRAQEICVSNSGRCNCLPFGLASAPGIFTKTLKPLAALSRELGIRLIVYINDIS